MIADTIIASMIRRIKNCRSTAFLQMPDRMIDPSVATLMRFLEPTPITSSPLPPTPLNTPISPQMTYCCLPFALSFKTKDYLRVK